MGGLGLKLDIGIWFEFWDWGMKLDIEIWDQEYDWGFEWKKLFTDSVPVNKKFLTDSICE